jgi:hypothetical protein
LGGLWAAGERPKSGRQSLNNGRVVVDVTRAAVDALRGRLVREGGGEDSGGNRA